MTDRLVIGEAIRKICINHKLALVVLQSEKLAFVSLVCKNTNKKLRLKKKKLLSIVMWLGCIL